MAGFLPYSYGGQSDVNHVGDVSRSAIAEDMLQPPQLEKGQNDDTWTQAEKAKLGVMRDAGNSLSEIVKAFPMHTENSVKQHWYKWDPYYIEPGSDEENHATRSTEPLYRQITSPHSVESPDISGTRSYAPQTGKMQTDHIDEDIVKTRASDDPHPMALGRTPQYPARFSAIRGARKESGLGMDRVVTLLQGLSNSIDEYVPGRDSATKFNPQAEHGYAAQVHQPTSLPNLVQSQSFPLLSDLQDPVISIVSSVVEDFEIRLRELIRSSTDLNDLESRIPIIRGQFLAQYGISTNEVEQDPPSLTSLRTMSSSPGSGRLTSMRPPDVLDLDQPQLGGDTNHDQPTLPSDSQQGLNVLPTETNAYQDAALEPLVTSDPAWLHHDDFPSLDDMPGWDPSTWNPGYETTNDASDSLYMTENTKDLHGYSALIQKESLSFS
ncbi:hypothetical protein KCU93_g3088, partial [Aureobasidium melanogenum]